MLIESSSRSEFPDCSRLCKPLLITPSKPTPIETLHLSNLDNQPFVRFPIQYIFLYQKSVNVDTLKSSLALALVHYYPLAGRLRICATTDRKFEVECNGEGAVFLEASVDLTVDEAFKIFNNKPDKSWMKLMNHNLEYGDFIKDIPPLIVQVTYLKCGGMILSTAISHVLSDGSGTFQFLHAWASLAANQDAEFPIQPFHSRQFLSPRDPPIVEFDHLGYYKSSSERSTSNYGFDLFQWLNTQPDLVPSSIIFSPEDVLRLKGICSLNGSIECTSFEALVSHTWRSWVQSLPLPSDVVTIKLLFSINVRSKTCDVIPEGYYGNAFVFGCAETTVENLVNSELHEVVSLVQAAKTARDGEYVKSLIDLLQDESVTNDLRSSFVLSEWTKLGLVNVDFGGGKCVHLGTHSSICCLFLPVLGQKKSTRVLVSLPKASVEKFEGFMKGFLDEKEECNGKKIMV